MHWRIHTAYEYIILVTHTYTGDTWAVFINIPKHCKNIAHIINFQLQRKIPGPRPAQPLAPSTGGVFGRRRFFAPSSAVTTFVMSVYCDAALSTTGFVIAPPLGSACNKARGAILCGKQRSAAYPTYALLRTRRRVVFESHLGHEPVFVVNTLILYHSGILVRIVSNSYLQ